MTAAEPYWQTPEFKARKAVYDKARRLADPERKRAASRTYYEANRDKVTTRNRAWAAANRERMAELMREWRRRDLEAFRAANRAYYRENREKFAASRQRYRAAKKAGGGNLTEQEWVAILDEFEDRCAYCNASGLPLEMEHMTPLIRGGLHKAENVVPACRSCNRRKGRLTALEFLSRPIQPSRKVLIP